MTKGSVGKVQGGDGGRQHAAEHMSQRGRLLLLLFSRLAVSVVSLSRCLSVSVSLPRRLVVRAKAQSDLGGGDAEEERQPRVEDPNERGPSCRGSTARADMGRRRRLRWREELRVCACVCVPT